MKKVSKFLIVCLIILLFVNVISFFYQTYAVNEMFSVMEGVNTPAEDEKVQGVINTIIGLLQVAGTGIALITITMMGLKYIMASPGEKADVKKQVIPIIIGCILLFGAVTLMSAIYDFAQNVLK